MSPPLKLHPSTITHPIMIPYPDNWPQPDPHRPTSLQSRITDQQKLDLYNRKITTRSLAKLLHVHENYLSSQFPGRVPLPDPKKLQTARREFRNEIARLVLTGKYNINEASNVAHCSYNTMFRHVQKAKQLHPELVNEYHNIVQRNRKTFNKNTIKPKGDRPQTMKPATLALPKACPFTTSEGH